MKKQIIKAVASLNEDYGNGRYYKLMAKFYDQEYSISYVDILFFSKLARKYGDREEVDEKWQELLVFEAEIMKDLGTSETVHG